MTNLLKKINFAEYLLYLFVFLLPLQTRWIFVDSSIPFQQMSVYGFDVIFIILVIIIAFQKGLSSLREIKDSQFSIKNKRSILLLTSYSLLLLSLLSTIWSSDPNMTLYWSMRLLLGISLIWLVTLVSFDPKKLIWFIVTALLLQAMLGIGQFLLQDDLIVSKWLGAAPQEASILGTSVVEAPLGRWLRAHGTQGHPNILGGLMGIGILSTLYFSLYYTLNIVRYPLSPKRIFLLISLILFLNTLFFSFSRSVWIALIIVTITEIFTFKITQAPSKKNTSGKIIGSYDNLQYTFNKPKKYITKHLLLKLQHGVFSVLASLVLLVLCIIIFFPLIQTRLSTSPRLEQQAITQRVSGFAQTATMIPKHPLLGVGLGNYTKALRQYNPSISDYQIHPVHNIYALITAELGGIGIILFVIIILITFTINNFIHYALPITRYQYNHRALFTSALMVLLIANMFDHYLLTYPSTFYLFWLLIALIVKPTHRLSKNNYNMI